MEKSTIKSVIYEHHEFASFIADMNAHFAVWRDTSAAMLKELQVGCRPREIIAQLSEGLLAHYGDKPLIDPYDIYQHMMDYWAETMQDDCYFIASEGWKAETYRVVETDKKGRERDKGWMCDLVPKALIVARYFSKEQAAIDRLVIDLDSVTARLAEMEEEHGGEDGAFSERDKVNKANVTERLKEIKGDKDATDEAAALNDWLKLNNEEADLKKRIKESEASLDGQAYAQYPKLTEAEIKTLVVDDKWLFSLDAAIRSEMDRVSQQLTQRVKDLAERYEIPLPQILDRVVDMEKKGERPPGADGVRVGVKLGYKQTEIGVIPEDWEVKPIAGIATTVASDYVGHPWIQSSVIFQCMDRLELSGDHSKATIEGRAILIARVGANAGTLNVVVGEYGVTDNTIIVRISDSVLWSYVWRQLDAKRLNSMVFGSGQPLITGTQIKNLLIPFPPTKAEQEAIAGALSDADALIESLEQLLAKKRQIKKGAMQELLTGKKAPAGLQRGSGR